MRWSDCADAQAGLRLCCSQNTEDRFSRAGAHKIVYYVVITFTPVQHLVRGMAREKGQLENTQLQLDWHLI